MGRVQTPQIPLSGSRLRRLLSCTHVLPFISKQRKDSEGRTKNPDGEAMRIILRPWSLIKELPSSPIWLQSCYRAETPLYLPFSPLSNWTVDSPYLLPVPRLYIGWVEDTTFQFHRSIDGQKLNLKIIPKRLLWPLTWFKWGDLGLWVDAIRDKNLGNPGRGWMCFAYDRDMNNKGQRVDGGRQTLRWPPDSCLLVLNASPESQNRTCDLLLINSSRQRCWISLWWPWYNLQDSILLVNSLSLPLLILKMLVTIVL